MARTRIFEFAIVCAMSLTIIGAVGEEQVRSGYVIKAGDGLSLKVYGESDLDAEASVLKTGEVSFPLIGRVRLEGLTVGEASTLLFKLYDADYLVEPKLTLTITDYAPEFVDILGEVKTAGRVKMPASGQLDLASLFAMAGGFTEEADKNAITIVRGSGEVIKSSAKEGSLAALRRVALSSGDRVIVGKSAFFDRTFTVLGEIKVEGPFGFPLDGKLDLVAAIALAGGLTDLANPKKVTVRRGDEVVQLDYQALSRGGRSYPLRPGDIVTVARRIF
jgi:polysaccharide export outer membrane protein